MPIHNTQIILWFEDNIDVTKSLGRHIEKKYDIQTITIHVQDVLDDGVHDWIISKNRPTIIFCLCNKTPEVDMLENIFQKFAPIAIVTDLRFGNDIYGGIAILSTAKRVFSGIVLAVYSGETDKNIRSITDAIGVKVFMKKTDSLENIGNFINSILPSFKEKREVRESEYRIKKLKHDIIMLSEERDSLQTKINRYILTQKKQGKLRQECNRLQKKLDRYELAKKNQPTLSEKQLHKKVRSLKELLDIKEKEYLIALSYQHDMANTSSLVRNILDDLCTKVDLLPPFALEELKRAQVAAKHTCFSVEGMTGLENTSEKRDNSPSVISEAFADAMEMLARKKPDSIQIKISISQIPPVSIPQALLVRCIFNLLLNALEAIPGKGLITVTAKMPRPKAKYINLIIRDNGKGILKRDMDKITEWNFSSKGKKWGMGLFIVKSIMDNYRGDLRVKSIRGKHTIVTLKIPLA